MSIVLFCTYCSAVQVASNPSIKDLETEAIAHGWRSSRKGWLCPAHRGETEGLNDPAEPELPSEAHSAETVLWEDSVERWRRLHQQSEIIGIIHRRRIAEGDPGIGAGIERELLRRQLADLVNRDSEPRKH